VTGVQTCALPIYAEKRWAKGDFKKVMKEQDEKTCIACGFSEGFFKE
jgi:hypothetical protein